MMMNVHLLVLGVFISLRIRRPGTSGAEGTDNNVFKSSVLTGILSSREMGPLRASLFPRSLSNVEEK